MDYRMEYYFRGCKVFIFFFNLREVFNGIFLEKLKMQESGIIRRTYGDQECYFFEL